MIFASAVLMFSLAFCESDRPKTVFGVDVGGAEIIADSDSHGWLGDGERLLELKFSGDSAEADIAELWRPLPASEKVEAIIWGDGIRARRRKIRGRALHFKRYPQAPKRLVLF